MTIRRYRRALRAVALTAVLILGGASSVFAQARAPTPAASGRKTVLVSPIETDRALTNLPSSYSDEALRRELEVALENTGYFTVASRGKGELEPVLKEFSQARQRPKNAFHMADLILHPTLEGFNITERRRRTPMMRGKDSVTVQGTINMTIEVTDKNEPSVHKSIQIDAPFHTGTRLLDPLPNDPLTRTDAYNGPPTPEEVRGAYQEFGRLFAKRVLDQVFPAMVVGRSGDRIYISRGEDAGYQIGDTLRIIHRGAAMVHPVTHEVIGYDEQVVGEVKVVETLPKMTVAQIVKSTGEPAQGDVVREPPPPPAPRDDD